MLYHPMRDSVLRRGVMVKQKQKNVFIAGMLVLSLSADVLMVQKAFAFDPTGTVNMNKDVTKRQAPLDPAQPILQIHGREHLARELYDFLYGSTRVFFQSRYDEKVKPLFLLGAEGVGKTSVIEAMLIDQAAILNNRSAGSSIDRSFIVHSLDVRSSEIRYEQPVNIDDKQRKNLRPDPVLGAQRETSERMRMRDAYPNALNEALKDIRALNQAASSTDGLREIHVLKIRVDGMTPGFGEHAGGGVFEQLQAIMSRGDVPMIIEMDPSLYKNSFGKIVGIEMMSESRLVEALPVDKLRAHIYDRFKEIKSSHKKLAASLSISQLVLEEMLRVISAKGGNSPYRNLEDMLDSIIREKIIGVDQEYRGINDRIAKIDYELNSTQDANKVKSLNLEKLENLLKLKAAAVGQLELTDLTSPEFDLTVGQEESTLGKIKSKISSKITSLIPWGKKEETQVEEKKITWEDVLPKSKDEQSKILKRVNDFAERIGDLRDPDVTIKAIHKVGERWKIDRDQLNVDPENFRKNFINALDKRVIGLNSVKRDLEADLPRVIEDIFKGNKVSRKLLFNIHIGGATGTGKTELIKALADALGAEIIRIDGQEYQEKHSMSKLLGAPPGYVGGDKKSPFQVIKDNPGKRFVILWDEINRMHEDVRAVAMKAKDDGKITISTATDVAVEVSLQNTGNAETSNWAPELFENRYGSAEWNKVARSLGFDFDSKEWSGWTDKERQQRVYEAYVKKHYGVAPEQIGRTDDMYLVPSFDTYTARRVIVKELLRLQESYKARGMEIKFGPDVVSYIQQTYDKAKNGRGVKAKIKSIDREITRALSDKIRESTTSRYDFYNEHVIVIDAGMIKETLINNEQTTKTFSGEVIDKKIVKLESPKGSQLDLDLSDRPMQPIEKVEYRFGKPTIHIVPAAEFEGVRQEIIAQAQALREEPVVSFEEYMKKPESERRKTRVSVYSVNNQEGLRGALTAEERTNIAYERGTFLTKEAMLRLMGRVKRK